MKERFNSLRHFENNFNSLSHIGKQERFNSLSHLEKRFLKRGSIRWLKSYFLEKVQFRVIQKKVPYFWVISQKSWILWVELENFNSLSRIQKKKKVQCRKKSFSKKFNSVSRIKNISSVSRICISENSILRAIIKKGSNLWWFFCQMFFNKIKKGSSLWVFKKIKFFDFFLGKKVFESCLKKKRVQLFESYWKNSLSHIEKKKKKNSSSYRIFEKTSILWVVFFFFQKTQKFNSLSQTQKKKSLSHAQEKYQFFESCSRNFNSLSFFFFFKKKKFNSSNHFLISKERVT